jgi:transcriptional regulator with XRE-family HTH domain
MGKSGLNQSTLAEKAAVSRETVWRILHEKSDPEPPTLKALAEAMEHPLPAVIFTESGASIVPRALAETLAEGSGDAEAAGWMWGEPSEAEEQFRTVIRNIEHTLRGMVGEPARVSDESLRKLRLAACRAAMESAELAGRPVPEFVHRVYNEVIEGRFG